MTPYIATGEILDGRLKIDERDRMIEEVSQWPNGPIEITFERLVATRSHRANAYYWGVVSKGIAGHTGHTPEEVHDTLKLMFLPKDVAFANGNGELIGEFIIGGSTR